MVSGWFRRAPRDATAFDRVRTGANRGPSTPSDAARAAMVSEFLQLDERLSIIADGVGAADELGTDTTLATRFEPVRDEVYRTIDWYLRLSGSDSPPGPVDQAEIERCTRALRESIGALDAFYAEHSTAIENARSVRSAVPDQASRAARASDDAVAVADTLAADLRGYSSVQSALSSHRSVRDAFDRARSAGDAAALHALSVELTRSAEELRGVVAAAPGLVAEVRRALDSVRTRWSAVRTRAERLPLAYSALLREFSAACSEDLIGHDRLGDEALRAAGQHIAAAGELVDTDPDAAAARVTSARARLTDAEHCIDGVTDRLALLRDVRSDPAAVEGRVRFQIRDAQLLAVDRRLVARWGSVLDAAAARIDRATAALTGAHPDYWGYVQEMDSIAEFVGDTVAKMKGEVRR